MITAMASDAPHHDIVGIISRSPLFDGLPAEALQRLANQSHVRTLDKNAYLYTIGDSCCDVFCILSGRVRLLLSSELGQEFAINDLEPEAWLGEQFLANDLPTALDARIAESADVLVIPRPVVLAVGQRHPQMYKNLFEQGHLRWRGVMRLLVGMAFYPLRNRLAGRFLALIEEHGQASAEGVYLDVHLSQNDFAQLSVGSRQRINKIISEWRDLGIIDLEANRYLIRDTSALEAQLELKDNDD